MGWHKAQIIAFMEEQIPFNRLLGIRCEALDDGVAVLRLPFRDVLIGDSSRPALHGGVLSTLIDTAGGAAAFTTLETSQVVATIDMLVDYLRPAPMADLAARAEVVRRGNRVILTHVRVYPADDPSEVLIASGRAAFNVVDRRG